MTKRLSPQQRAERCARLMMERDTASTALNMEIVEIKPGAASLRMQVTCDMINGHGTCHGGYIFTLADSAFAFACNSYNQVTVAQQNQITYVAPATANMTLTAVATETARQGRSGTYDVCVTDGSGATIALFRGLSRTLQGQHFPEPKDTA